ncbi:MAG: PilW family protein [Elusimicrobiota bacterium]
MINRGGYTLVEVIIALLLTAVIVSAVFSLALTIKAGHVKIDRHLMAQQSSRELTSVLKSYVTADCSAATINGISAPNGSWSLTGIPGVHSNPVSDSCGSCYALAPGHHVLSNYIPSRLSQAPYNGKICYDVNYAGACSIDPTCTNTSVAAAPCQSASPAGPPSVCVNVYWVEPKP